MANQNYLAQILRDNAPVGSVGAPGGVLNTIYNARPPIGLPGLLGLGSLAPGIGDAMGLLSDAAMYADDPRSRTTRNYMQTALGILPLVPSAAWMGYMMRSGSPAGTNNALRRQGGYIGDMVFRRDMQEQANWLNAQAAKRGLRSADDLPSEDVMSLAEQWRRQHPYVGGVSGTYYRGGSKPADGGFYSRDADYARGFDKGHFGSYKIDARHALNMDYTYAPEDLDPLFDAMRSEGDVKAADMLQQAVREDGGVLGSHLYMMMERVGMAAPEYYFGKAGIQAIDTGRDVRVLDRAVVNPLQ